MIRLYDTATRSVRELELRDPGKVSIYVCGPTVYDHPHLGHGRFVLVFDVLRRYLLWSGLEVNQVSNVTDIDDNIINRAAEEGRDWKAVAAEFEEIWFDDLEKLGVMRPDQVPHATDYVDQMVAMVSDLIDAGAAYVLSDGVYFRCSVLSDYGALTHQNLDDLRSGARIEVDDEKEDPADFALWKIPDSGPTWPSPWGAGRPGWHTECVAMSLDLLGDGFDLHGGGQDLIFPHHENERAQSCALGRPFAQHWVHNGWVVINGEKMGKSLGNARNLTEVLEDGDERAYRLLVLQAHYRSPLEVTEVTLAAASAALERLDAFARRFAGAAAAVPDEAVVAAFRAAMDDDLNTPVAMATMFKAVSDANRELDSDNTSRAAAVAASAMAIAAAVGLELGGGTDEIPSAVTELFERRNQAREQRDWSAADAARDELMRLGWRVEDGVEGASLIRISG